MQQSIRKWRKDGRDDHEKQPPAVQRKYAGKQLAGSRDHWRQGTHSTEYMEVFRKASVQDVSS